MTSAPYLPDLRVRSLLARAWKAFRSRTGLMIGATAFIPASVMVLQLVLGFSVIAVIGLEKARQGIPPAVDFTFLLVMEVVIIFFMAGFLHLSMLVWQGKQARFSAIFAGFRKFWRVLGFYVITTVAGLIIWFAWLVLYLLVRKLAGPGVAIPLGIVAYIGIMYLSVAFMPGLVVILETELGPVAALGMSWKLTRSNRWRLLLVLLVGLIVFLVGMAALLVGALATGPLFQLMLVGAYDELARAYVAREEAATAPAGAVA